MAYLLHTNFTSGEVSPRLDMRVQLEKFNNGCAELQNFVMLPQGGVVKRSGLRFIHEVKDSSKKTRIIPFQFSTETAYILEFGDGYIRFYMDGGIILASYVNSDYKWVSSGSGTDEYYCEASGGGDPGIDEPQEVIEDGSLMTPGTLGSLAEGEWAYGDNDSLGYSTIYVRLSDSADPDSKSDDYIQAPYKISSPYAESELYEIQFTQSADVMYLVHPNHQPRKLSRTGHTSWSLDSISFTSQPDEWGENNWPGSVTFYKQRLGYGGVPSKPGKFWLSVINAFDDFTTGTADDDACVFQLVANEVNAIRWMIPGKALFIGTSGAEWECYGSAGQITPTDITADRYTSEGSISHVPIELSGITLFLHRSGRKLHEFAYVFEQDSYKAPDLTIVGEHLTRTESMYQLSYQRLPHGVVWAPRTDGVLLGFTYLRSQEVMGWHRHITDGEVEWTATIKGDMEDELWCVVKRTINGSTRRYIERLDPEFTGEDIKDAFFVDSGLSYDGPATSTISGLGHLEGEEVHVLADGSVHPPKTVSDGQISLDREAERVHAGLPYVARLKTLDFTGGAPGGTTQSRLHKISRVSVHLHETVGGYLGPNDSKLEELLFRSSADEMGKAIPPYSGTKFADHWAGYEVESQILYMHDSPLPATVLGFVAQIDTYGME